MEDNDEIKDPGSFEEEPADPDAAEEDDLDEEPGAASAADVEVNVDLRSPRETKFACPFCHHEQEHKTYGKNICTNLKCGRTFYVRSEIIAFEFVTLNEIEAKEYNKVLAHINNRHREKDYPGAYRYCLKAEEIAPGESTTWERFVLTVFLLEITRSRNIRKSTIEIIKLIKIQLDKCKDHGITDERYEELLIDIANRLFNKEKSRINSFRTYYRDELGKEKWTRQSLYPLLPLLRSFEICYGLYKDPLFLEEHINELTKPYKWLVRSLDDGEIRNTHFLGTFNAKEKLRILLRKMQEHKPDYELPEIKFERFEIMDTGQADEMPGSLDNQDIILTSFKILSVE
jgi:hypothetical protein